MTGGRIAGKGPFCFHPAMRRTAAALLLAIAAAGPVAAESYEPEAVVEWLADRPDVIRQAVDRILAMRAAQDSGTALPPPADPLMAYLEANPRLVLEALDRFEAAQLVKAHADALFGQPDDPYIGNPDGSVMLVTFTDYNCPYCQAMVPVLQRLAAEEPELKIVYKEMPILAESSWYAAQVALVAHEQGLYREFHETLFGVGARSERLVRDIAGLVGVDLEDADLAAHDGRINANLALGQDLGLDGTPAYVVGERILVGQTPYEELKAAIAAARPQP